MTPTTINTTLQGYLFTTDKSLMKLDQIHRWLSERSYWAEGIPYDTVKTTFDHSFCIGMLQGDTQVGYARMVTDYAVFGYLADVFVLEEHRGKGLSKIMLRLLLSPDWVVGLRGIRLATKDAQGLYEQFGFTLCKNPERQMEITRPGIYKKGERTV